MWTGYPTGFTLLTPHRSPKLRKTRDLNLQNKSLTILLTETIFSLLMINVSGSDKIQGQHFLSLISVIQGKAAAGTHAVGADKGAQISVWYTCVHQMSWTWHGVLLLTSHSWYLSQLFSNAYLHPLEFTYSMNKVNSQVERGPRCVRGGFHSVKPGFHLV